MQYEAEYGRNGSYGAQLAAHATPAERARFITNTYLHLFGAVALFAVLEVVWFNSPVAEWMFSTIANGGRFIWLAFMAAFVGVSYMANSWALSDTSRGRQYLGLGLYALFESLLFVPMIAYAIMVGQASEGGTPVLTKAILITLTLFGGLTGVVFITRKDFSFMRSVLMFGGMAAMGLIVLSILFNFTLGLAFSYAMVALACGYILFDTSNVLQNYRTNQHVAAALALFASVMLLFWYVLRIFLQRRD